MTITAKVIEHSRLNEREICTLQLRYPRFIHAEFMTHRMFSRNASSSRAIPVARVIADIQSDPAMPSYWGKNQPGMQAGEDWDATIGMMEQLDREDGTHGEGLQFARREERWQELRDIAIEFAKAYNAAGYHKQIVNRILEPWAHINVVVTATEWDNFFKLRLHADAQPEIQELAKQMAAAINGSSPVQQDWHLPYVTPMERMEPDLCFADLAKLSAARCARVSYMTHEGKEPNYEKDMDLAEKLLLSEHMSPFEHAAYHRLMTKDDMHANFKGWKSFRFDQGF